MHLVLIHGQGRTSLSMRILGSRLKRSGYTVHYFSYSTRSELFDNITQRLIAAINTKVGSHQYALLGHSLGAVIARASLPALANHPPSHLFMLAPPNHPSLLARRALHNPLYRFFTGDCGNRLGNKTFYQTLPEPVIPTTIIAGTAGPCGRWSPFGQRQNDGILAVEETSLGPEHKVILVPSIHTLIMNSPLVFHHIQQLLHPNFAVEDAFTSGNSES